jgi:lysophospholipase L1-like esterase
MKIKALLISFLTSYMSFSQNDTTKKDWANLKKYASENQNIANQKGNKVVFMGDSITEFWQVNDGNFFVSNAFLNRGISGQTTPQMLLRFRQDVIALQPKVVVILAGINDIAENTGPITIEGIMDNIISMCQLAKANQIKVVLCSVLPANHFNWNPKIQPGEKVIALNKEIKAYATKNGIPYVDYFSAMVNNENGLDKKYGEDGVHPNLEGYKVMEALVMEAIKKVI